MNEHNADAAEPVERISGYLRTSRRLELQQLGIEHRTSMNAQLEALVDHYLDEMSPRQRQRIIEAAQRITRERRRR